MPMFNKKKNWDVYYEPRKLMPWIAVSERYGVRLVAFTRRGIYKQMERIELEDE